MKKFLKGLATVAICSALNFGSTADVQAAELEPMDSSGSAYQEMYGPPPPGYGRPGHRPPPPPPDDHWGHRPPPPPPGDHWGHRPPPPPPGDHWGHRPPPPPPHRR